MDRPSNALMRSINCRADPSFMLVNQLSVRAIHSVSSVSLRWVFFFGGGSPSSVRKVSFAICIPAAGVRAGAQWGEGPLEKALRELSALFNFRCTTCDIHRGTVQTKILRTWSKERQNLNQNPVTSLGGLPSKQRSLHLTTSSPTRLF